MEELDIVERLRGKVRVPVNDGAGLLHGKDFFERTFPTSKAAMDAADEIERLRAQPPIAPAADVIELAIRLAETEMKLANARKALEEIRQRIYGPANAQMWDIRQIVDAALSLTDEQ